MTVKEHESRKQRSLSLNSLSEHMSGEHKGEKVAHRVPAQSNHHLHNNGRYEKEHLTNKNEIEHSPADLQRVKGLSVVLTPMGNENFNGNRNLATMHSIFS